MRFVDHTISVRYPTGWRSARALKAALESVQSDKILHWGAGGGDKCHALEEFKRAGLSCPEFTRRYFEALQWAREGHIVWGRKFRHKAGTDIVQSWSEPQWARRDYWLKFIPSTAEYRQHVWNDKAIMIGKKKQVENIESPIRARHNGWHIDYSFRAEGEFRDRIRALAKGACRALGYIGGAVDVLEGLDGQLYLLEVNTAPALKDAKTLEAYVKAITEWAHV